MTRLRDLRIDAEQRAVAARVLAYLRPYRGRAVAALGLAALGTLVALIPILALRVLVDHLTARQPNFSGFLVPVLAALGAGAATGLINVAMTYVVEQVSEGVVFDLREQLFAHFTSQGATFFAGQRGGDLISRMLNDIGGVYATLSSTLLALAQSILALATTLVLMIVLDWRLALLSLVLIPLAVVPTRRAGARIARARGAVQQHFADVTTYLQETLGLSGMLLVRVFGRQETERRRFGDLNAELRRREIAAAMTASRFSAGFTTLNAVVPAVLMLAGGYLVANAHLSPGTAIVFATIVAARLGGSLQGAATAAAAGLGSVTVWRRIFDALDTRPEVAERPGAITLTEPRGSLALEGASFTYPGQARPALQDISFVAEPGQTVALVGPSGAGKTTLGALIARLLDPDEGRVLIDGHDVRDLTLATMSATVGLVLQETFLFHATLAENLRFGRPAATVADLAAVARDTHLDGVISALPDGYDTIVGERGHRLSGGEKQRVAIARTTLADPRVLVLDEATSHLDSASEQIVQHGLQRLVKGRTAIVIAHRLSTVQHADLLLVLDQGRIVQRGSHAELLATGGLYAHLHALQSPAQ